MSALKQKPPRDAAAWLLGPKITMSDLLNGSSIVVKMRSNELAGKSGGTIAGAGITRKPLPVAFTPKPAPVDPLGNDTWELNT